MGAFTVIGYDSRMQHFWNSVADGFVRKPWIAALLVLLISSGAGFGLSRVAFDDSPHNIFKTEDAEFQFLSEVLSQYGADDNDCLLMVTAEKAVDIFSEGGLTRLSELERQAASVEGVQEVVSLVSPQILQLLGLDSGRLAEADLLAAQAKAQTNPLIRGQLLSEDARATLLIVRLDSWRKNIGQFEAPVAELRDVAKRLSDETNLTVEMTGIPPLRVEIFAAVESENRKYTIIGSTLAFAMAFILFRRLRLVMIAATGPVLGALWTIGFMGLLGQKINVLNVVLPTLVIVVGFTSAIHLLVDARRSLADGASVRDAVRLAIAHLGGACTLAMFTTMVGFASLVTSSAEILRQFGLACAGGVICSFTSVVLTAPLLMLWLMKSEVDAQRKHDRARLGVVMEHFTAWIIRHRKVVVIAGCLATLLPTALLPQLYPDTELTETIPEERESFQTLKRCDQVFGGVLTVMVVVDWSNELALLSPEVQSTLKEVEATILETEELHYPLSVRSILRTLDSGHPDSLAAKLAFSMVPAETYGRMYRMAAPNRTIVTARLPDLGAAAYLKIFAQMEQRLEKIADVEPGVTVRMTGTPILAARNINQMVVDLATSLTLAAIVIFGVITVAFRSLKLGLLSLVPNSFPLVLTAAMLVVFSQPLQLASVIVFTICLGLAVDDTIHYLNRFRRELSQSNDVPAALRRASHSVGAALVTSTLVLLAGFGSVIFSEIPTSRLFASLACTAMGAALLGDLVFLPALLAVVVKNDEQPVTCDTD
ncbi:MAG: efflux RND transporter permease subunit [Pirellulales bacterium]|nr:efflux RND transporter permease subunit [Pirellulales bacterium]